MTLGELYDLGKLARQTCRNSEEDVPVKSRLTFGVRIVLQRLHEISEANPVVQEFGPKPENILAGHEPVVITIAYIVANFFRSPIAGFPETQVEAQRFHFLNSPM